MWLREGLGLGHEPGLDLAEEGGHPGAEVRETHGLFGRGVAADEDGLAGLDVARADLQPERHAAHLVLGELPAGRRLSRASISTRRPAARRASAAARAAGRTVSFQLPMEIGTTMTWTGATRAGSADRNRRRGP